MKLNDESALDPVSIRRIRVGGVSKPDLLVRLREASVHLNEAGLTMFADDRFTTSAVGSLVETVQQSVAELGFSNGATFAEIAQGAARRGLTLCDQELAPHLRLQFLDQPEGFLGQPVSHHCAPPGAVTVASRPLADDDDIPKGFYLRRIEGTLWLRGYRSTSGHVWSPRDVFVFALLDRPTQSHS